MNHVFNSFLFVCLVAEFLSSHSEIKARSEALISRVSREISPGLCRLCRGKPRKCTCYIYKRINGRTRCSYNDRVPCDNEEKGTEKEEDQNRLPKYKRVNNTEYFSKNVQEICGKTMIEKQPKKNSRLPRQGRIINGTKAEYIRWPWQVSLRVWNGFNRSYIHKCGAALLSRTWVITAGHCVKTEKLKSIQLVLGEYDMYNYREEFPEHTAKIRRKIIHPKFEPVSLENDLALLELISPVKLKENIIPACLHKDREYLVGQRGWVTGWGITSEEGSLSPVLRELEVPILSNRECERLYSRAGHPQHIPLIFVCAGYKEGGRDSCDGDSGGPLSVELEDGRWYIAGVVSWGIGCGEVNQPGVMVRLAQYTDWIQQYVKEE